MLKNSNLQTMPFREGCFCQKIGPLGRKTGVSGKILNTFFRVFPFFCHRSLQNQPLGVESKPATPRRLIHIWFLDLSKWLFNFFISASPLAQPAQLVVQLNLNSTSLNPFLSHDVGELLGPWAKDEPAFEVMFFSTLVANPEFHGVPFVLGPLSHLAFFIFGSSVAMPPFGHVRPPQPKLREKQMLPKPVVRNDELRGHQG
jgi:hypothetical protein